MVNIGKKLPDVAFQDPTGFRIVFTDNIGEFSELVYGFMRAFVQAAWIWISDESFVKKWIKFTIDGVVQKSIANYSFMDVPGFGIIDFESLIAAVFVGMIEKFVVKCKNIVH